MISTRRSSRSAGAGATVQSLSRIVRRLGEEVGQLAGIEPGLTFPPPGQQHTQLISEPASQPGHQLQRAGVSTWAAPGTGPPVTCTPSTVVTGLSRLAAEFGSGSSIERPDHRGQPCHVEQHEGEVTSAAGEDHEMPDLMVPEPPGNGSGRSRAKMMAPTV